VDSGGILEGHPGRKAIHLARRNRSPFGVGVIAGEGSDSIAWPHGLAIAGLAAFGYFFDDASDFNSGHKRRLGRAGINAHTLKQVGEVHSNGLDANYHLTRLRLGIGRLLSLKNFGAAIPPNDHSAHLTFLRSDPLPGGSGSFCVTPEDSTI
jgi:hypothetical protein